MSDDIAELTIVDAQRAVINAANLVAELRGELYRKQQLRNSARAKLAAEISQWQASHQLTPTQLLQQHAKEQLAIRAERAANDPDHHRRQRLTAMKYVQKNMRGLGPNASANGGRHRAMGETALMTKQILETGSALPFSKYGVVAGSKNAAPGTGPDTGTDRKG